MTHTEIQCDGCGAFWSFNMDEDPVIMEPFPHEVCPNCGWWIPMF